MCPLYHPPPRSPTEMLAGIFALASLLLIGRSDVGLVAPGLQLLAHLLRVVGRVQAQVLLVGVRLLFFGSGARYQQSPSKVATSSFASWRLAPSTATAKGMPAPSVSMLYVSSLSWPDRWGSCRSRLVLKGPYSSPHHRWPATPLDAFEFLVLQQPRPPQ